MVDLVYLSYYVTLLDYQLMTYLGNYNKYVFSTIGVNSGRMYWMLDSMNAPYEWKSKEELIDLLQASNFANIVQLKRGIDTDQIEQITQGLPFGEIKYGESQLKIIAKNYDNMYKKLQ